MQTELIDDEGKILGAVNVIDLLVTLIFIAVIIAGAALVFQSTAKATDPAGESVNESMTVVVETTVPQYVADAIEDGSPVAEDVTSVDDVRVVERLEANGTQTKARTQYRVRFTTTFVTQSNEKGLPEFRGKRLYIGRTVRLDLGVTIVDGVVVEIHDNGDELITS